MELNRFRPYSYTTFYEIVDKHIRQVNRHLVRYDFTEYQFTHHLLPQTWSSFRIFILHCTLDFAVLTGLLLSYLNSTEFFKLYNRMITQCYGIAEPETISFSYLIVVICSIDAVYLTFYWVITYKATCMRVLFEFRDGMDREVPSPSERSKFSTFFNLASYQTGNNLKILLIGFSMLTVAVGNTLLNMHSSGQISLTSGIAMLVFYIACQVEMMYIQYMMYALLCGYFFNLKIFRYKTKRCLRMALQVVANVRKRNCKLSRFEAKVMDTHRVICFYNRQVREYNFVVEFSSKIAIFTVFLNGATTQNLISCGIFFLMYGYSHFMGERVSFYQSYAMPTLASRMFSYAAEFSWTCDKFKPNRRIWNLLRSDRMIAFFSGPNQFAFSYGAMYAYTKYKVVENLLMFVYILLLVYKRQKLGFKTRG